MITDITPRRTHIPVRPLTPPVRSRPDIYRVRRRVVPEPVAVSAPVPVAKPVVRPQVPKVEITPAAPVRNPATAPLKSAKGTPRASRKEKPKRLARNIAGGLVVLALVAVAGYVSVDTWLTNQQLKERVAAMPAVASSEIVTPEARQTAEGTDEKEPPKAAVAKYTVADDMPRMIHISKMGVSGRVLQMGINPDGSMQAPLNIYDAGWYNGSAKPGAEGAAVIDAHSSGPSRGGLFGNLNALEKGDKIEIEMGNDEKLLYKVVHKETKPREKVDMRQVMSVYGGAKEGLNLITCDGKWVNDQQTMADRVVVYTERV